MKKSVRIIVLTSFVLSLTLWRCVEDVKPKLENQSDLKIFTSDPIVSSRKENPKSEPLVFKSGSDKIAGRILMASGTNPKITVIFLHGNPGFEKNQDIGQRLRRAGYNTVFFSYSGTWGNEGLFSYKKSIKDVEELNKFLIEYP
jgi:hypothetical protein